MVIELGEADVFEGKISEAVERLFDRRCGPRGLR